MIYDALLVLWDCSQASELSQVKPGAYAHEGDADIYNRIYSIAKSHHKIQNFVLATSFHSRQTQTAFGHRTFGLYGQALSEGISEVLQSYKKDLKEVESLILENKNYTMSFVYSYVEKYQGLFNSLNRLISTIKERRLKGCQILSLVHQHILSGNSMVHDAVKRIFSCVNAVFLNQLCQWLLYGELKDSYEEFFIYQQNKNDSETFISSPSTVNTCDKSLVTTLQHPPLECGYALNPTMIPYFIPLSLAQEILFIGKTVNLFGCDPKKVKKGGNTMFGMNRPMLTLQNLDADSMRFTIWEDKEAEFHEKLQNLKGTDAFEVCDLRNVIRDIKECVTKHLWSVAVEEARLVHELRLMKDFYLLGRGELFLELLRLTSHILDKPTTRTSTRDMNHAFQLAARAIFLSNHADMDKFSFELPYARPAASPDCTADDDSSIVADGWSSVVLRYEAAWPLHLVLGPATLARYNDVFRLLLRLKKTQHDLHALWKTKRAGRFPMWQLHNKLMFVMDNLQHYLQADVLETNFARLTDAVARTQDFEELKRAHAAFLADVLSQAFLTVTPSDESDSCGDTIDNLNNPVFCNIMELLKLCHAFCSMSELDDKDADYYIRGYTERFNKLVKQLLQLLAALRGKAGGAALARLLVRLDFNRWLSAEAQLTQSVTSLLRY